MTLRQAGPEDLDQVMAVERACFATREAGDRQAWSRAAWRSELQSNDPADDRAHHRVCADTDPEAPGTVSGASGTDSGRQKATTPTTGRLVLIEEDRTGPRAVADFSHVIDSCDLDRIMVVPAARGAGMAGRLLRHGMGWAARRGARQILLEVRPDNLAALALYRSHGFDQIARRNHYYGTGEDALVMSASLESCAEDTTSTAGSNEERHV
ncbi:GNAT family N-acetyltransferase [Acidipropionibacterium jensenii]|uniref:GNAT family N-acetyltransferase n=1 Tax=Acidipropionibacterium jensenii TaxID=1749 RepID=UPI000BC32DC6|nr:GNAT family N-acetyltransferase [Acidipropionibacterium jensenii]AZZ42680.1 GNAT family N-acetyltransferase [Acidipropionibacterium jensenii]